MFGQFLTRFQFRLVNFQCQRFTRGWRRRNEQSSSNSESSKSDDQSKSTKKPKVTVLLDESVTDYLKIETAESQDPWSSPPYPPSANLQESDPSRLSIRPAVDPRETSIFLFPGQGAQYVGMAKDLVEYPNVADMFNRASNILGCDLLKLCMDGPIEELNRTIHCQPAIFVTSLACVEKAKVKQPVTVRNCIAAAGFSVGEIAALVFADAFSFEQGLNLIKVRAQAMQQASEQEPSGLLSVFVRPDSKLKEAMADAIAHMKSKGHPQPVCQIANYLFTQAKVVGGHDMALQFVEDHAKDYNLRCKRLPVSGAFHTPLMNSAFEPMKEELKRMKIVQPLIPVHSNVDGRMYYSPEMIQRYLPKQIVSAVRWEQIMHILYSRKEGQRFPDTLEMGPGQQLGVMLKKTNAKAANFYISYDVSNENPY